MSSSASGTGGTEKTVLQNIINGESAPAADGASMDIIDPSTGAVYATAPLSGAAGRRPRLRRRHRGLQDLALVDPRRAAARAAEIRRPRRGACRRTGRDRGAGHREADRADQVRRGRPDGRPDPVLRRRRPGAGRSLAGRVHARAYVVDPPGTGRGRRPGGAVELPDDDGDLEDRARARGRLHRRAQAVRHHPGQLGVDGQGAAGVLPARRGERDLR